MKRMIKLLNMKKFAVGTMTLMMFAGTTAFGADTGEKRKAHEIETRIMEKQAQKKGMNIISQDKAKEIAFTAAEVKEKDVKRLKTKLDREDDNRGIFYVYEVEFLHDGYEYEFEIDAENGEIIKSDVESWLWD